jgi:putative nucleotidyltransferase with HDIG domain
MSAGGALRGRVGGHGAARLAVAEGLSQAETSLLAAKDCERIGNLDDAIREYAAAAASPGVRREEVAARAEALRRHASILRRRQEYDQAAALCQQSYEVAIAHGLTIPAANALNGLGILHSERGEWVDATAALDRALVVGGHDATLCGHVQQNFGIIANIQGDFETALRRYRQALDAFHAAGDDRGAAAAYHNLGMISADRQRWDDAYGYFDSSLALADKLSDLQLRAMVLLNRTEVHIARQRYEEAKAGAEEALRIFAQLGVRQGRSEAYKFLGMVYRETGATELAKSRLTSAIALASEGGAVLEEAEATRELALLYRRLDCNHEALTLLNTAHRLFQRRGARADLQSVSSTMQDLERIYLEVVAGWGRSIESSDLYTHGHCERVAGYAARLATALGLDDATITTVRIGAYLHDVGKVRVPHEILNKPGRLTSDEREIMEQHPLYGVELLASVEFPWQVKPIIRWHHEKADGTGYPDRLVGDEIPLTAQIIGVVDVYDAMTSTRSYRAAMPVPEVIAAIRKCARWWRPDVVEAFLASVGEV